MRAQPIAQVIEVRLRMSIRKGRVSLSDVVVVRSCHDASGHCGQILSAMDGELWKHVLEASARLLPLAVAACMGRRDWPGTGLARPPR